MRRGGCGAALASLVFLALVQGVESSGISKCEDCESIMEGCLTAGSVEQFVVLQMRLDVLHTEGLKEHLCLSATHSFTDVWLHSAFRSFVHNHHPNSHEYQIHAHIRAIHHRFTEVSILLWESAIFTLDNHIRQ